MSLYHTKIKYKNKEDNKIEYKDLSFIVPTVDLLNSKLIEFHVNNFHCNYVDVQQFFKDNNIGFYGLNKLIEEYVANYPVCDQMAKTILKNNPINSIEVAGHNIRYEFDLTFLNSDFADAYGVRYLLSIIDVFNRKGMIVFQELEPSLTGYKRLGNTLIPEMIFVI